MRLRAFLYVLLRDQMPFGIVEKMIGDIERSGDSVSLEDDNLTLYVDSLAARLEDDILIEGDEPDEIDTDNNAARGSF